MSKQLILKEFNSIKYQCPRCGSWIRYEVSKCYYCAEPLNFKGRYPESLIRFLKKNLIPKKEHFKQTGSGNYNGLIHYYKKTKTPLIRIIKDRITNL